MKKKEEILNTLLEIEELPTIPIVIARILEEIDFGDVSARDIAIIMQEDPSLTTKVLNIANSAFYGLPSREITSVPFAISRMGFDEIRDICLSIGVVKAFSSIGKGIDHNGYWKHCITSAILTAIISEYSEKMKYSENEETNLFFVSGLLHDVGILILDQFFHEDYSKVLEYSQKEDVPLYDAELEMLGVDHGEVGSVLANRWNMPYPICETIKWHHTPDKSDPELRRIVQTVHISEYITVQNGYGDFGYRESEKFSDGAWFDLGLSIDKVQEMLEKADKEAERSGILFKIALD